MADETYTKEQLDKAIKDAIDEATKGLKDNLTSALDEAKAAKRKLLAASEIKPEDVAALEQQVDDLQAKLTAAEKTSKDATKAKETAEGALKTEQGFTHKLLVENGLREQLAANGVTNPIHQKAAMAMLGSQVQVTADGEVRTAKVGDKTLPDYVKEWAGGEEGKHFVAAPANSGAGAQGSRAKADARIMTRSAYDALEPAAKASAGREAAKGELKIVDEAA